MKTLIILTMLITLSFAQETPLSSPIQPSPYMPAQLLCEYKLMMFNSATPHGSGRFWLYEHVGIGRAGYTPVTVAWAATFNLRKSIPRILPSSHDPNGRLSWFTPDGILTPLSIAGIQPFSRSWLPRIHPDGSIFGLQMWIPIHRALIGVKFYIEGVWWMGEKAFGIPCGVVSPPIGAGNAPSWITIVP